MIIEELRLECLKLAMDITEYRTGGEAGRDDRKVILTAKRIADFVIQGDSSFEVLR